MYRFTLDSIIIIYFVMKQLLILLCVFCSVIARNPRPWELLGGMNPDFEDFIPPTPIVSEGNSGESAVDNYPRRCSFSE